MKITKVIAAALSLCMIGSVSNALGDYMHGMSIAASAADYTKATSGYFTYRIYSDHAELDKCDADAEGNIEIESEVSGVPVTTIIYWAFEDCNKLTSVTIPASITDHGGFNFLQDCESIEAVYVDEDNQFYSDDNGVLFNKDKTELICHPACHANTEYTIPNSVKTIGCFSFCGCKKLTSITIPDSVEKIQQAAFKGSAIQSIVIPASVTAMAHEIFLQCNSLSSATFENALPRITNRMFSDCQSLTSVNIPDTVTSIENEAFKNCKSLESIVIPDSVETIGKQAFYNTGIGSLIIPDSVTSVGDYAFYHCTSLKSITIPDSVTRIGKCTFTFCTSLASISIPDSVTSIGLQAFYDTALTSITVPESVTCIEETAFGNCKNLESITILNPECEIYDECNTIYNVYNGDSISSDGSTYTGTIYGYEKSTAQAYAEKYSYHFELIEALGDVNDNGEFNVADVVLLQKWLLAVPNTYLANWKAVDFCNDNKLDVFDLCLMKRELLQQTPQEDITLQGTIRFDMMGSSTPVVVYTDQLSKLAQSHMYEGDSVDNVPWEKLTMNNITFGDTSIVLSQPEKDGRVSIGALSVGETTITYKIGNVTVVFDIYVYDSRQQ